MAIERPANDPCPPPCGRTDATFIDPILGHRCPEHAPLGTSWVAYLTDKELIDGIHAAITAWISSADHAVTLAGRRDYRDFTSEIERQYPLAIEPLRP
jgi:hypothetical protein